MKKFIYHFLISITFILSFSHKIYCQVSLLDDGLPNHTPIFLGTSDKVILEYFNRIKEESPNSKDVVITENATPYGDKMLQYIGSMNGEDFVNCIAIITYFFRTKDGIEICDRQLISGTNTSLIRNLNFVKDNFKPIDNGGKWYKDYGDSGFKIVVKFTKKENFYVFEYNIVSSKDFDDKKY